LLRYARQLHALRSDVVRELGVRASTPERLPIAVNADSLATWVLPALDPLVQRGLREGFGLELVVDDQDFTHDWLRQGEVLGCVTTVRQALRGCVALPLGVMRYVAVASPEFVERELPGGLVAAAIAQVPFLVFNRKDDTQQQWVRQALGLRAARLNARYVPSSEAYVQAVTRGWGVGVAPELQIRPLLARGELVVLRPDIHVDVALYWHQWKLGADSETAAQKGPPSLLDEIGEALALGAREALQV
jgi:LysR family transcriptional regulator (chromosome initiation inhibitor)